MASLSKINEALESNDAAVILACLQLPTAKLNNVRPKNAELYKIILQQAKKDKAEVRVRFSVSSLFEIMLSKLREFSNCVEAGHPTKS